MKEIKQNSLQAWLLATRPKTLTGAIIPVLLGTALAYSDGHFNGWLALLCALFAGGMQVAANLINDLYDHLKGSDREDRLGPERACAQGWISPQAMRIGIGITVLLACLAGCAVLGLSWGTLPYGGWELIVLGALCVLFAFLYTTCLSYQGWGDVLVIVFFGLVPVGGTFYVLAHNLTADAWVLALVCGLVTDTLLVVNNYRDREQDALSGKRTLVVRFGQQLGSYLYLGLGVVAVLLCLWFVHTGKLTSAEFVWAPCVYLYLHVLTWRKMVAIDHGKKLNSILGETSRNMLFMGLLLSVAINN